MVEVLDVVERGLQGRGLDGTQTTTQFPNATPLTTPSSTMSSPTASSTSSGSSGPTSSPLLFFVALGFGVVFTNLWIIVGVKYCFRYNARNRALRNGEEADPINLENMPTRPHRRRREKKLMTMDEVNERFPLTKYKNWVATRAMEGLPTAGGVAPSLSRAGSVRDVEGVTPSSPAGTKHSGYTRPPTAVSEEIDVSTPTNALGGSSGNEKKSMDEHHVEKGPASPTVDEHNHLEEVQTTASTVNKLVVTTSEEDDDDDDDHIHTAVPPELLANPGDSCAICIDTLEEDDDIRGLTCGHAFHAGCLDPWLTSRRACCPLCKADYYTPKPRPEGEAADAERTGRRSGRMPQQPSSAWTGIRSNPRLILPGRFNAPTFAGDASYGYNGTDRRARRATRQQAASATQVSGAVDGAAENSEQAAPRRWRPQISNPFSNMRMPTIPGRGHPAAAASPEDTSPSQLEAGTVR